MVVPANWCGLFGRCSLVGVLGFSIEALVVRCLARGDDRLSKENDSGW